MPALFVTATGTDIGKTFVTTNLIRHLREKKIAVDALKPIVSGFDPQHADQTDTGALLQALGRSLSDEEVADISPWRFAAPLSPDMAARHDGKEEVVFEQLLSFCETAIETADGALLIEGVGGVMVPLDQDNTVLDWIAELDIPSILVTGSYLGSISHTLTAAEVMDTEGCELSTIVVSETEGSHVPLYETAATLSRFLPGIDVVTLPRLAAGADHPAFGQIAKSAGLI